MGEGNEDPEKPVCEERGSTHMPLSVLNVGKAGVSPSPHSCPLSQVLAGIGAVLTCPKEGRAHYQHGWYLRDIDKDCGQADTFKFVANCTRRDHCMPGEEPASHLSVRRTY